MKLFVSNLDEEATLADLAELFCRFGQVEAIRVRMGQKRRYGIVEMDELGAKSAMRELDGRALRGKRLEVEEAQW